VTEPAGKLVVGWPEYRRYVQTLLKRWEQATVPEPGESPLTVIARLLTLGNKMADVLAAEVKEQK
jgi:hypothetical protein